MDSLFLTVTLGAIAAGFVQGLSGFGFGLTAMSIWAWTVDPKLAAAMSVFGALIGQILAVVTVRRGFDWKRLLPFLAGGLAGIPIGVSILPLLDVHWFKAVLGGFLVAWCPLMLAMRVIPKITAGGRIADSIVGALGGIMGGIGGFTGPIPTLWCALRGFPKDEQRSVIQSFNLAALFVTFCVYLAKGFITRDMLPMLAVLIPATLIPAWLGARLYVGISEAAFKKIVLGLLTVSGLTLLASSLPALLQS